VQNGGVDMTRTGEVSSGLVSTIIPVFNRAGMFREAVESVLAQTYRPIEIIVVDDGSTDETAITCDELARLHPEAIRAIHQTNRGPGLAREAGRRAANGEFIQYLDSDDRLLPTKFEVQVAALRKHPECGVAYCWTRYTREDGRSEPEPWKGTGQSVDTMFPSFLTERWWDTPTPLYRRTITDAAGPWTDLRVEEDWEYDCRIAALGTRLAQCPEFLVEVRDHADGRLCQGEADDPKRLSARSRAHLLIYGHARRAGIEPRDEAMQIFARELFHISRQCGAVGLGDDSRRLFDLAREASGELRSRGWDFRLYGAAAAAAGWRLPAVVAAVFDRLRAGWRRSENED